jgi:hypothetical protein
MRFLVPFVLQRVLLSTALLSAVGGALATERDAQDGIEYFETHIRPILIDNCAKCHGEKRQRADLRLDSPAAIRAGGERGPLFVAGDPDASLLIRAVRYNDEDLQMPERGKLADEDIAKLEKWVSMGAPMPASDQTEVVLPSSDFNLEERRQHWAFQPLKSVPLPDVARADWPLEPLDHFILKKLEQESLAPAAESERRQWLRRVSYDLTGLPPTPTEVRAFEGDLSRDAYERAVDRLLASSAYGERWSRSWLDLMRYAETKGHEFDYRIANAFQYRDYVTRALNADVPFDQFTKEHIAGDLLPEPRLHPHAGFNESVLGTGFWFLGEEVHSPVDIRGDETDRVANKVDVLSKAFLGLTVACARCHDHKFDAISTKDYYALCGFAMSGDQRQVRFDSIEHNGRIAKDLEELRAKNAPRIVQHVGERLLRSQENLAEYLLAAHELIEEARQRPMVNPPLGRVFEDFEDPNYGAWETTGTAFGNGAMLRSGTPSYQGDFDQRGLALVNSHQTRHGENIQAADAHTGTLTSPEFEIEKAYIHFLLGGGGHDDVTGVELLIDDERLYWQSGKSAHRMAHYAWDVSEWRGRRARLRVVDQGSEGWGNVAFDHVVFSELPGSEALDAEGPVPPLPSWEELEAAAKPRGLDVVTLAAWVREAVLAKEDRMHPLHPWLVSENDTLPNIIETRTLASYSEGEELIQDGSTFGSRARRLGEVQLGTHPERPIERVFGLGAAWKDSTWDGLRLADVCEREPSVIDWVQSGRTVRTPSVTLTTGKLYYLVRGAGRVVAPVDSHRMLAEPLHIATVKRFDDTGEFRWVEHDLTDYIGHRVHVELSPADFDPKSGEPSPDFAVASVIEASEPPDPYDVWGRPAWSGTPGAEPEVEWNTRLFAGRARSTLERFANGVVESPWDALYLNWLLDHPELTGGHISLADDDALAYFDAETELRSQIQEWSRTAPAMLEGSGVDEFVLIRGSHKSPGEVAARSYLDAISGPEQEPIATGSGRLVLAEQMTDPANPQLSRVIVNRLWYHVFGRGIVATVDNFGRLGEAPSHPELLDFLAMRFMEDGWSQKRLLRSLVLSRTYRMASRSAEHTAAHAQEVDPNNVWLHRASIRRLPAESIRDGILAVSGHLDREMFGPSIPMHLTDFLQGRGRPGSGPIDGKGRRSLYISVRRNFATPFFRSFDFPTPATAVGRRSRSNVPAQALMLMNDPFVIAEAKRLAERVLADEGDAAQRITSVYELAFARGPNGEELTEALDFLTDQGALYEADANDVRAWADLCHVLFNVKEFIFLD